jgi:hypothetical protein
VDKDIGRSPDGSGCQPTASAADASSRSGIPNAPYVAFSVRDAVMRAIEEPGLIVSRCGEEGKWIEHRAHWQARAALEVMLQKAASSPLFAQAIEARRAETLQDGSVHESAVPKGCAHE